MAEQTIPLLVTWYHIQTEVKLWAVPSTDPLIAVDAALSPPGTRRFFESARIGSDGTCVLRFASDQVENPGLRGDNLSTLFETNGSIYLTAGGNAVQIALNGRDRTEPYSWIPSNVVEVMAFYAALPNTGTIAGEIIIRDFIPLVAPSWTDDTGDAITGVAGTAITRVTVPAVNAGNPAPTYAASGLPTGLAFNSNTREISGTPAAAGSGTITITATNSVGSDTCLLYTSPSPRDS